MATRPEQTAPPNVPCVACMIESQEGVDACGYPLLQRDLPVAVVFETISNFVESVLGWLPLERAVLQTGKI